MENKNNNYQPADQPENPPLDDIQNLYVGSIKDAFGSILIDQGTTLPIIIWGEVLLYGHPEGDAFIVERLRRVALYGTLEDPKADERIGIFSMAGPLETSVLEPGPTGSVDGVIQQLHYAALSSEFEPLYEGNHAVFPPMETMAAKLIWEPGGNAEERAISLMLSFTADELIDQKSGVIQAFTLDSLALVFYPAGSGAPNSLAPHNSLQSNCPPPPPGGCSPSSPCHTVTRTLPLKFINLSNTPAFPPVDCDDSSLSNPLDFVECICRAQIMKVCEVWRNKAALELNIQMNLEDGTPQEKTDYSTIDPSQPSTLQLATFAHNDPNRVEVYFVDGFTGFSPPLAGGGDTFSYNNNTASTICFINVASAQVNPYLLAHELGHMLGLQHPDGLGLGAIPGSPGSIMEPGTPNPPYNTFHNCRIFTSGSLNPIVSSAGPVDCFNPDYFMAQQFEILGVNPSPAIGVHDFTLPLEDSACCDTYISILTLQPALGEIPAPTTYVVRHVGLGVEVAVPAFGTTANLMNGGTKIAEVSLADLVNNGLATIHILHTPAPASNNESWEIKVSHAGASITDFFGVIAHSQALTQVPKMSIVIGTSINPNPLTVNFGKATFNVTSRKSAVVFNTGTAPFTLGTISLDNNATNFYALTMNPSNAVVNPNGKAIIEVSYTPVLPPDPPPVPPHTAILKIPVDYLPTEKIVNLTGEAMLREIVLLIDASNSMNGDNAGVPLAGCPVGSTRLSNYDPDSRMRQVRAALQTFQSKLSAYGDKQTFLSIVLFPGGDLPCGSNNSDAQASPSGTWKTTIMGRTLYDQTNAGFANNILASTEDAFYHATPMTAGLQESIGKFTSSQTNFKVILLLSDGSHNVPVDPAQTPLSLLPTLTNAANPIRVCSIGFGTSVSVDHALLQDLARLTGEAFGTDPLSSLGYFEYNPTAPNNVQNLEKYYTEIFADLFALQGAIDPTKQISRNSVQKHVTFVTEYDQRVTFTLSWITPIPNLLGFELIAPNGERITSRSKIAHYYEGPKHKMYAIDIDQLPVEYIGEWILEVNYGMYVIGDIVRTDINRGAAFGGPQIAIYNYDVITRSGLELEVQFDKDHYQTEDRVVISASLTENGRALLDQDVVVQVQRPGEAMGNWYAENPVSEEVIQAAFAKDFGTTAETYSMVYKKQYYLTNVAGVHLPDRVIAHNGSGLPMQDDGQNGDLKAQDGIYTVSLDDMTTKPGTYYFMVIASGKTSNGNSFRRERLIHVYVQTKIDTTAKFTKISIEPVEGGKRGLSRFRAYLRPQDTLGNLLGPGFASLVNIHSSLGHSITDGVKDDLVGGYYKVFEYDPNTGMPIVEMEVGDESLPVQIVGPEIIANAFWRWLYKAFPWLAEFLAICRNNNLLLLILILLLILMIILKLWP